MEKNATKQWPESTVNPIGHLLDYEKKKSLLLPNVLKVPRSKTDAHPSLWLLHNFYLYYLLWILTVMN